MLPIQRPFIYSPRRYGRLIEYLQREGVKSSPRGIETREMLDAHLVLRDPQDRLIFDPGRRMNIGFAIADWLQIMIGDDTIEFLEHFVSGITEFADPKNKEKVGGAYGPRLKQPEFSQIEDVINRLKADPFSRQAVISIYDGAVDLQAKAHVVPCTLSLQFLIRDDKLHAIASMRSNDVVWGLTYDIFNFTMIQEYIAAKLGLSMGDYRHHAGSLHLYVERDKKLIKRLGQHPRIYMKMDHMPEEINIGHIYLLFKRARDLVTREFWSLLRNCKTQYEKDLALVARYWAARKAGERYEAEAAYKATSNQALRKLLRLWPIK